MTQFQIENHVGIDKDVAAFMMRSESSCAKTAMDLLRLAVSHADRPTLALLQAAVDDCKKAMAK